MVMKFYFLVFIFILIDVCVCYPLSTPQLLKDHDKLEFLLKLTMYKKKPEELVALGEQYCNEGKFNSAIKLFDRAIKKAGTFAEYYRMRGDCHQKMGKKTEAVADFEEALRINNTNTVYRRLLSDALIKNEEFAEAINVTIPLGVPEIVDLGNTLLLSSKHSLARECYSEAITRASEPEAEYYMIRGLCHQDLGSLKDALEDLRQAFEMSPQNKEVRWHLTSALLKNEEYEEALQVAFGMDVSDLSQLAYKLYHGEKFNESGRCYSELIMKDGDNAKYYEMRGSCYWRTEKLELAILDYDRALKMKPDCTSCRMALLEIYCEMGKYIEAGDALKDLETMKLGLVDTVTIKEARKKILKMRVASIRQRVSRGNCLLSDFPIPILPMTTS